jgi:putative hydrolase of the HAD superfamily
MADAATVSEQGVLDFDLLVDYLCARSPVVAGTSSIQVVFLDAAGTLFHVKGSVGAVYLDYARKYGVSASSEAIERAFQRAFADAPPLAFSVTDPTEIKACERLWWFDVVHNVFYRIGMFPEFDDYFDEVFNYFASADAWNLFSDTVPALEALKQRGLELGVVSNFDSRLYEILIGLGIDRFFDSVTLSTFVGAAKPAPQIFQRATAKHGVAPKQALHIGDSLLEDVRGAAAAGLHSVLLNRRGNADAASGIVAIKDLGQVLTVIDRGLEQP